MARRTTHSETGLRAPYADADAFVDAAVRLAQDPALRGRLGRQARVHAVTLTWDAIVDRFAALLTEATDPQAPQPAATDVPQNPCAAMP